MNAPASPPKHNIAIRVYDAPTSQARKGLRILLLKLDHIGDFLTAIEAFRVIRHAFAGAEITLICLPAVVAMAESTGLFDRVAGFNAIQESAQLGKVPSMHGDDQDATFATLLNGPYFLAADFKHDASTRVWLDHVDAEVRAGFVAPTRKGLDITLPNMEWDVSSITVAAKNLPVHAELRLTLLAHAICETLLEKALDADLFQQKQDLDRNPSYRALVDEKRMKIGLCLGAGSPLRQWRPEYWRELLQQLVQSHNALLVFFGGPGDKVETQALTAQLDPATFTDLTAAFPLASVPVYMNLLDSFIGCDTGLTHLAANLGIPTVNIFAGISNVSVWRARGPRVKTVYAETLCAPCHLRFAEDCPNGNICMAVIVPEIVYACFEQVIAL
jgi:ADP-heptose:LPS heptosyltransferase